MTIPVGRAVEYPRRKTRMDVGLTAFGLAVLLFLLLALGTLLLSIPSMAEQASISSTLWLVQSSGMILSFLLGLAAVITGRGRAWGAAAMVISVLGNSYVWMLVYSWMRTAG
ncbi:hypothetical protein ACFFGH_28205 [Lysobacter korlensis]|uniref:Uncharacterized protein n=1 Tax=Lysobacter korlensis TaxID=553636 RepID=A0ABV6RZ35_9GAMM